MPSQGQSGFSAGVILNSAVAGVLTWIIYWDVYTIPESFSWIIKIYFSHTSYAFFTAFLTSSLGAPLVKLFRWSIGAALILALAPFVLLWQFGQLLMVTVQRAFNTREFLQELESSTHDGRFAPFPQEENKTTGPGVSQPTPVVLKSTYQYQPLWEDDEVRLLEVFPATKNSTGHIQLRGRIIHAQLGSSPAFTALSYCWNDLDYGASTNKRPDPILDLGSDGTLVLTRNLHIGLQSALKRGYFQSSLFWVDQICINQEDLLEKGKQVAMMKDIYKEASLVLVWLGEETATGEATRALRFAEHITKSIDENNLLSPEFDFFPNILMSNDSGIPPIQTAVVDYMELIKLVTRPWFQRSWIVQEVSLNSNKRVLCGSTEISFDALSKTLLFCHKSLDLLMSWVPMESRMAFQAMIQSSLLTNRSIAPPSSALLDVLVRHRGCKASLASDKVFAFLNISDDVESLGIKADYTVCSRFAYPRTAVAILQSSDNLDILSSANAWPFSHTNGRTTALELSSTSAAMESIIAMETCSHNDHPAPLSSWVPDWSVPNLSPSFQSKGEYGEYFSNYRATGDSVKTVQFRHNNHVLGLDGLLLDRVIDVGQTFPEETGHQIGKYYDMIKIWAGLCGAWESEKKYAFTKESMLEAFAHTLTCGDKETVLSSTASSHSVTRGSEQKSEVSKEAWLGDGSFAAQFKELHKAFWINWMVDYIWPNVVNRTMMYGFLQMMVTIGVYIWSWIRRIVGMEGHAVAVSSGYRQRFFASVTYRRFIVTEEGLIGLAAPHVQPNDYVALFAGGKVPIVLRDAKGKDGFGSLWEIVGDAYVHGAMFGEFFPPEDQRDTIWIS